MKNLIFLMGLPRSGTTLIQRVLSVHPEIASVAEPWVLLPMVTCFNAQTTRSVYGVNVLERAIADLKVEARNFQQEYDSHIRSFINEIYTPLRGNKKYFLDKTPRYYLIAEELHRLFPEAKFIYLFRNPIDVFDSVIETFCGGNHNDLLPYYLDMSEGLNLLCEGFNKSRENSLKIIYEDFCANGEIAIRQICDYLKIEYRPEILTQFSQVQFSGKFGDPKRNNQSKIAFSRKIQSISVARRHIYAQLLEGISKSTWEVSGFQRDKIFAQLEGRPVSGIKNQLSDLRAYFSFVRQFRVARLSQRRFGKTSKYGYIFY